MRVQEQHQREQEESYADELSFREWLHYYMNEVTGEELNDMEKQAVDKNLCSLPHNNPNYNNLPKGA